MAAMTVHPGRGGLRNFGLLLRCVDPRPMLQEVAKLKLRALLRSNLAEVVMQALYGLAPEAKPFLLLGVLLVRHEVIPAQERESTMRVRSVLGVVGGLGVVASLQDVLEEGKQTVGVTSLILHADVEAFVVNGRPHTLRHVRGGVPCLPCKAKVDRASRCRSSDCLNGPISEQNIIGGLLHKSVGQPVLPVEPNVASFLLPHGRCAIPLVYDAVRRVTATMRVRFACGSPVLTDVQFPPANDLWLSAVDGNVCHHVRNDRRQEKRHGRRHKTLHQSPAES
mmetsp:Transcript_8599/g.23700  ORF Transcript_8599/g.23700 Transcript_8599/m.23700 type:complete len:280 (+) Transcript_8599:449-1288(+)